MVCRHVGLADNGSFPKPYGYSIFQLDNMATLCQVLSTPGHNLWKFELPDGRSIQEAMKYGHHATNTLDSMKRSQNLQNRRLI
jgi:hypothetical protein